jgi:uncharacterized protein (DUF427 family)
MSSRAREIRQPGPEHPITIEPNQARVLVTVAGRVIADTTRALTLREAGYRPVEYIPIDDVVQTELAPSEHASYCPYKGDASYYSLPAGGGRSVNAVWSYLAPYPAVAQIAGHVAFYPERVDEIRTEPAEPRGAAA